MVIKKMNKNEIKAHIFMQLSQIIRKTWRNIDKIIKVLSGFLRGNFLGPNYSFSARVVFL